MLFSSPTGCSTIVSHSRFLANEIETEDKLKSYKAKNNFVGVLL